MRGCWRLCCRTRGRGRATAEDGMCSRVEADEREASPKLNGYMGTPRTEMDTKKKEINGVRDT